MKKLLMLLLFCSFVLSEATAEFVITPSVGISNLSQLHKKKEKGTIGLLTGKYEIKTINSYTAFACGLDLGFIGKNGLSFFFNNNLSFSGVNVSKITGKIEVNSLSQNLPNVEIKERKIKGVFWHADLLFGKTWKSFSTLYISLLAGLSGGVSVMNPKEVVKNNVKLPIDDIKLTSYNAGLSINVGVSIYFTKNIGINLSITEIPGVTASSISGTNIKDIKIDGLGFANVFYIKIGPSFKF